LWAFFAFFHLSNWDSLYQVGFEMIDKISQAEGIAMNTIQSKALIGIGATSAAYLLWSFLFSTHVSIFIPISLLDQYRFHWWGTNFIGQASSIHELQWGSGLFLSYVSVFIEVS